MEQVFGPLNQALHFLGTHADLWAYAVLFVAATTEMVFPPFPGDMVFLSGMVLAGGGALSWPLVFVFSFAGGLAGVWVLYELGHWKGRKWFCHPDRRFFNPKMLNKIEGMFGRYGFRLIIISRFFPAIRSVVPIAAGVANVPRWNAASFLALSIIFWNALLAGIGVLFGRNWEIVTEFVTIYNRLVIAVLILGAVIWGAWLYKTSRFNGAGKTNT